jgi:hypothetical protein
MQDKVRQQRVNAQLRKQREAAVAKQRRRADAVRRPLRPFWRAVLTEIYLCDVYSCQEILRRNGRVQERDRRAAVVPLAPQQHAQAVDAEYWSQLSD